MRFRKELVFRTEVLCRRRGKERVRVRGKASKQLVQHSRLVTGHIKVAGSEHAFPDLKSEAADPRP